MISFDVWLSQIFGYCEFVANDYELQQAWINKNFSNTSITNFDELYEQIFDDLDSDVIEEELENSSLIDKDMKEAVSNFLSALRVADENNIKSNSADLLASKQWQNVVMAAKKVLMLHK